MDGDEDYEWAAWWRESQALRMAACAAAVVYQSMEKKRVAKGEKKARKKRRQDLKREPRHSPFFSFYLESPNADETKPGGRLESRFRRNFRVDRDTFDEMVQEIEAMDWASSYGSPDVTGRVGAPLPLLVLCALNALGRATVFEQFEDLASVSKEQARKFFLEFCQHYGRTLFHKHVSLPTTQEEFQMCCAELQVAGLDGCLGLTDAVQLRYWNCSANLRHLNTGKEGHPTVGFNVTVSFRRRILHTTPAITGRLNDQTKALMDSLIKDLQAKRIAFRWKRYGTDGRTEEMVGPYLVVDGGYQAFWCLVAPDRQALDEDEHRFTEWLESVRKSVECTFGILKSRFSILHRLRFTDPKLIEDIWFTCCGLHNLLLDNDGMDDVYEQNVSVRETLSFFDRLFQVPPASNQLQQDADNAEAPHIGDDDDAGDFGVFVIARDPEETGGTSASAGDRESAARFREKLKEHWTWKFRNGRVQWPSRTGLVGM
jgi:hypothetical protein